MIIGQKEYFFLRFSHFSSVELSTEREDKSKTHEMDAKIAKGTFKFEDLLRFSDKVPKPGELDLGEEFGTDLEAIETANLENAISNKAFDVINNNDENYEDRPSLTSKEGAFKTFVSSDINFDTEQSSFETPASEELGKDLEAIETANLENAISNKAFDFINNNNENSEDRLSLTLKEGASKTLVSSDTNFDTEQSSLETPASENFEDPDQVSICSDDVDCGGGV